MDRSEAHTSEVFTVIITPGQSTPVHKHDDTEQIFYVVHGSGFLEVNEGGDTYPINPGDVIRIPPSTIHRISCSGGHELQYLAIDCFLGGRPEAEPTWNSHVKAMCLREGWKYDDIAILKPAS